MYELLGYVSSDDNQAFTRYQGSFCKHARECGALTEAGATAEVRRRSSLNPPQNAWGLHNKDLTLPNPLERLWW